MNGQDGKAMQAGAWHPPARSRALNDRIEEQHAAQKLRLILAAGDDEILSLFRRLAAQGMNKRQILAELKLRGKSKASENAPATKGG